MKTIGAYLRVSTSDQSINLQREEIDRYLSSRGAGPITYYSDEGFTGTNGNRPSLRRLLSDVRDGKITTVACWKLDRLFRSLKDLINTLQMFEDAGVVFVSVKDQIDLSTPAGRLLMHMLGSFAQFEAALIRERTKAGMDSARRRGVRMGRRPKEIDLEAILTLRTNGMTVRAIAAQLQLSRSLVHRVVSKAPLSSDGEK